MILVVVVGVNNMKLKHWWWKYLPPNKLLIDKLILELSMSDAFNRKVTERLKKAFISKYCK